MIGSLRGVIGIVAADWCLVETAGGVGYRVFLPTAQLAQLSQGKEARLLVHTAVREDAITLYGFLDQQTYELFLLLLNVSGIGPKLALGVVSAIKADSFYLAVQSRDLKVLTKLPGIGKKTAERLLLELKDKVGAAEELNLLSGSGFVDTPAETGGVGEAMEALQSLGYSNSEIMPILKEIPNCSMLKGEEILKQALKLFAKKQF